MRVPILPLVLVSALALTGLADKPPKEKGVPPGQAKKGAAPPGLAKKGGVPPGLAKKFGPKLPERPYIAFDPRKDDRAWFLMDGRWVLKTGFEPSVRVEVQHAIALPPVPPPVPLPTGSVELHVVLFR